MFIPEHTNPLLFLNEIEKAKNLKSEKDKMYEVLQFVKEDHKGITDFRTSI